MKLSTCFSISKLLVLFFFLGGQLTAPAQGPNPANTGLSFDQSAYNAFPLIEAGDVKNQTLPRAVDLKKYAPFPGNQGPIASCVGWSVGYSALTILQAIRVGITDRARVTGELAYSASFIYNQIKGNNNSCDQTTSLADAMELLAKKGDCLASTFPNSVNSCDRLPNQMALREAGRYRVYASARLFAWEASAEEKIRAIKIQLARNNPVVIGMRVSPKMVSLIGQNYWNIQQSLPNGHAMTVVGYNDDRRTFELMNSYGMRWGNQGFINIRYEDLANNTIEAFVLDYRDTGKGVADQTEISEAPVFTSARMAVTYVDPVSGELLPAPVQFNPATLHYELEKKNWVADRDGFGMTLQIPKGRYAYLLNINTRDQVETMWTMSAQPVDSLVQLPSGGYYQFPRAGTETFTLLLSHQPIDRLETLLRLLRYEKGAPLTRLQAVFRERLIDPAGVEYQQDTMQFAGESDGGVGMILPVVVTVHLLE